MRMNVFVLLCEESTQFIMCKKQGIRCGIQVYRNFRTDPRIYCFKKYSSMVKFVSGILS